MGSHVAAMLYLLGRRITTALRVRVGNDEIMLPRNAPAPLASLHDALANGEDVMVDPWVDRPDEARVLVCLWMRADTPGAADSALPADLRPQLVISQGRSSLLVWALDTPTDRPGGIFPADALKAIADALDGQAGDPRDYIPVPRDEASLAIRDPTSATDADALVQWATSVIEGRAKDAALARTREEHLLRAEAGAPEQRAEQAQDAWEAVSTEPSAEPASLPSGAPMEPVTDEHEARDGAIAPESAVAETARTAGAEAPIVPPPRRDATSTLAPSTPDAALRPLLRHLLSVASRSCGVDTDEALLQAVVRYAMATLGTAQTWNILGVSMTTVRDGRLFGLRNGRWTPLLEAPGSPNAPRRLTEEP